jgi:hypothetical protein
MNLETGVENNSINKVLNKVELILEKIRNNKSTKPTNFEKVLKLLVNNLGKDITSNELAKLFPGSIDAPDLLSTVIRTLNNKYLIPEGLMIVHKSTHAVIGKDLDEQEVLRRAQTILNRILQKYPNRQTNGFKVLKTLIENNGKPVATNLLTNLFPESIDRPDMVSTVIRELNKRHLSDEGLSTIHRSSYQLIELNDSNSIEQ